MTEGKTLRMDTKRRSKFYVSGPVSNKIRVFHQKNNGERQLWFSVEQIIEAGLEALSTQKSAA